MWLGYQEEFPDYMTQGETQEELQENLRDMYENSPVDVFHVFAV